MYHNLMLIILGPTGVGKTDFSLELGKSLPVEIINGDMGQFYTPLSIGTAKPEWRSSPIPHHLFDIINEPSSLTVTQYRGLLIKTMQEVWDRGNIPLIVGGSSFYIKSILYPPIASSAEEAENTQNTQGAISSAPEDVQVGDLAENVWQKLYERDPVRAASIHPHDTYRISRALSIIQSGQQPSALQPLYSPPASYFMVFLNRERALLRERIFMRVRQMVKEGLVAEVASLQNTPWEAFLRTKKMIGYNEIFDYLDQVISLEEAILRIGYRTSQYAKRQVIFWRMLEKQLACLQEKKSPEFTGITLTVELSHDAAQDQELSACVIKQIQEWIQSNQLTRK